MKLQSDFIFTSGHEIFKRTNDRAAAAAGIFFRLASTSTFDDFSVEQLSIDKPHSDISTSPTTLLAPPWMANIASVR